MPLAEAIRLEPATRPAGVGVLAAARPLTGQWMNGVTFTSGTCLPPAATPYCPDVPVTKDTNRVLDPVVFEPFGVFQGVECSAFPGQDVKETAGEVLDATRDWQIGRELAHGLITGNIALDEAVTVGSDILPVEALALLEQAAVDVLYGRQAWIHMSVGNLTRLYSERAIIREGGRLMTIAGSRVVVSAGYDFPELIATSDVWAAAGERDTFGDPDRAVNTQYAYAEDVAVAAFDPCLLIQTTIGAP